ncbi:MAG TPA: hypothetical protein VF498_01270 [Anaerolineales bacterium]
MTTPPLRSSGNRLRIRIGLGIVILGLVVFLLGAKPSFFGLDRSPGTGFVEIAVFEIGLALICLGGYISLSALWNGREKTIAADIGLRLVSTGYVISVASGMADVLGFGSQTLPNIPYFGPWQAVGTMIGEVVVAVGFLLLIPPRNPKSK